jgi:hypothetical protein
MKYSRKNVSKRYKMKFNRMKILKNKYKCNECMKYLSSKQSLKEHKYSHTDAKPYMCPTCFKSFRHGSQFTNHKQSHKLDVLTWPKLTDLLKNFKQPQFIPFFIIERVKLPQLGKPQAKVLPSFHSLGKIILY